MVRTRQCVLLENLGDAQIAETSMPVVGPKYILAKTTAVAFHPIDQVLLDYYGGNGCIVGCEFAGVVEEVGSEVELDLKPGDRICGFAHGCKTDSMDVISQAFTGGKQENPFGHEHGAYASHVVTMGDLCIKIPDNLSDIEAAALPTGLLAAGMALYMMMRFPKPDKPLTRKTPIFIYGGSANTGVYLTQLARLSGLQVLTTGSPQNHEYLKSLGADLVFDYHSPTLVAEVRRACPMISDIIDCVSDRESGGTAELCSKIMCLAGGNYLPLMHAPMKRDDVRNLIFGTFAAFGERFTMGPVEMPAMPEVHAWSKQWFKDVTNLLAKGKVKPHRQAVVEGGLPQVVKFLKQYRDGERYPGYKTVFPLEGCQR